MKNKELLWIILSVAIIEFDFGDMTTQLNNLLEWVLIDVPLLLGLYWLLNREPTAIKGLDHDTN